MDLDRLQSILTIGENVAVEFKRCGNGIESDTYETVCSFLNRFGGDIFMGVLEDVNRVSLRNILAREMISNTLMHREFTSSYVAKFVIEKNRMYVENANRAFGRGLITPENMQPNSKNPIIASFFRTIGLADNLGSGTRKLFKYSRYYSGGDPELIEDDVFRINVPLDDAFSFDYSLGQVVGGKTDANTSGKTSANASGKTSANTSANASGKTSANTSAKLDAKRTANEKKIIAILRKNPLITQDELAAILGITNGGVRYVMNCLKKKGSITRIGSNRNGGWRVNEEKNEEELR